MFDELAFDASAHHERLDGRGYYRNLKGDQLSQTARILATARVMIDRPLQYWHRDLGVLVCRGRNPACTWAAARAAHCHNLTRVGIVLDDEGAHSQAMFPARLLRARRREHIAAN